MADNKFVREYLLFKTPGPDFDKNAPLYHSTEKALFDLLHSRPEEKKLLLDKARKNIPDFILEHSDTSLGLFPASADATFDKYAKLLMEATSYTSLFNQIDRQQHQAFKNLEKYGKQQESFKDNKSPSDGEKDAHKESLAALKQQAAEHTHSYGYFTAASFWRLDITSLTQAGALKPDNHAFLTTKWKNRFQSASISIEVDLRDEPAWVQYPKIA